MTYKNGVWDEVIKILEYTLEKLKVIGPGVMYAEVRRVYDSAVKGFDLPLTQLSWILTFICDQHGVLGKNEYNTLDANEQEAALSSDLYAHTSEEGLQSVRIAAKRAAKAARMKPITDAEKVLAEAKKVADEKARVLAEAQDQRDRPGKELSEAEKAVKAAEGEVKKAEIAINSGG